jgi:hypothetical protein
MANGDNPRCPMCGHPLDIIVNPADASREVGACTNPDCPSNNIVATWD